MPLLFSMFPSAAALLLNICQEERRLWSPWKVNPVISHVAPHCFFSHNSEALCDVIAVGVHLRLCELCSVMEHNVFYAFCVLNMLQEDLTFH